MPRCPLLMLLALLPAAAMAQNPSAIQPPATATRMASYPASGVQIYVCSITDGATVWTLKAPDANLFDAAGTAVIHHFAGPTWEARDGSKVVGTLLAKAQSPDAGAIPWLLLKVTAAGSGLFAGVRFVQRIDTRGGAAPAGACAAGTQVRVAYNATYVFYR